MKTKPKRVAETDIKRNLCFTFTTRVSQEIVVCTTG